MLNVIYSALFYHILMFHHHTMFPVFHHLSAFAEPLTITALLPSIVLPLPESYSWNQRVCSFLRLACFIYQCALRVILLFSLLPSLLMF